MCHWLIPAICIYFYKGNGFSSSLSDWIQLGMLCEYLPTTYSTYWQTILALEDIEAQAQPHYQI